MCSYARSTRGLAIHLYLKHFPREPGNSIRRPGYDSTQSPQIYLHWMLPGYQIVSFNYGRIHRGPFHFDT